MSEDEQDERGFLGEQPLRPLSKNTPTEEKPHYLGHRDRLRERFSALFRHYNAALTADEAFRVAEVMLEVIRSLNPLYAAARPKERKLLVAEYKGVLSTWLAARLA